MEFQIYLKSDNWHKNGIKFFIQADIYFMKSIMFKNLFKKRGEGVGGKRWNQTKIMKQSSKRVREFS